MKFLRKCHGVVIDALYFRLFMDDVDKDEINEDHELVKLLTY